MRLIKNRKLPLLMASVLAVFGLTVTASGTASAAATVSTAKYYGPFIIRGYDSNKCLDEPGWNETPGQAIDQWDCVNQDNEKWLDYGPFTINGTPGYYQIINHWSGLCLASEDADNDSIVRQEPCSTAGYRVYWRISTHPGNWFTLSSMPTGKCLHVLHDSRNNGAAITQHDCGSPTYNDNKWYSY